MKVKQVNYFELANETIDETKLDLEMAEVTFRSAVNWMTRNGATPAQLIDIIIEEVHRKKEKING